AKGQEAMVRFELRAVQKAARLEIRRAQNGLAVTLDDASAPLGTISGGTLAHEIQPGTHVLRFTMDGFQPKRISRDFAPGDTVTIEDVILDPLAATLDVSSDNHTVVVKREGRTVRQFTGNQKVSVPPGTYTIEARDASGNNTSRTVTVGSGESKSVALRTVIAGMDGFERPSEWTKNGQWVSRNGGNLGLHRTPPVGRISFTVKPKKGFMGRVQRIRWVVGFVDTRNYMLMEMDDK